MRWLAGRLVGLDDRFRSVVSTRAKPIHDLPLPSGSTAGFGATTGAVVGDPLREVSFALSRACVGVSMDVTASMAILLVVYVLGV